MIRQYYEEWPDEIASIHYPFVDTATLRDNSREMDLLPEYIRDARLWPNTQSSRVFLRSIERSIDGLIFTIADNNATLMSAQVGVSAFAQNKKVVFLDAASRVSGWIQFAPGALVELHDHPTDVYRFSPSATEFVSSAVASVRYGGVTGFAVGDAVVSGDVELFGGRGVSLGISIDGAIEVSATGDPYARRDICGGATSGTREFFGSLLTPVRAINVSYSCGKGAPTSAGTWTPESGELCVTVVEGADDVDLGRPRHYLRAPSLNGAMIGKIE